MCTRDFQFHSSFTSLGDLGVPDRGEFSIWVFLGGLSGVVFQFLTGWVNFGHPVSLPVQHVFDSLYVYTTHRILRDLVLFDPGVCFGSTGKGPVYWDGERFSSLWWKDLNEPCDLTGSKHGTIHDVYLRTTVLMYPLVNRRLNRVVYFDSTFNIFYLLFYVTKCQLSLR